MIIRLIGSSGLISAIPFLIRTQQAAPPGDNSILAYATVAVTLFGSVIALILSVNTARVAASKSNVEGLNMLITQMRTDLDATRLELKSTREELQQTRAELEQEKHKRELSEASNAYMVRAFIAQHPAEIQYALSIGRGDEPPPDPAQSKTDSDPTLRQKRRRGPQ